MPEAKLGCVVGIGSDAWDRLYPGLPRPADLHELPVYDGPVHHAPSTPGDLLFHIRAHRMDLCFELAQRLTERLGDAATVIDEVHGFRSFDERDLLGFVDGTENPEGDGAVEAVTVTDADDPEFAGSSYVVVQKYLHDLTAWDALSTEAQERAIGRTQALRHRDGRRRQAAGLAHRAQRDRGRERRRAGHHALQPAVRHGRHA